MVIAARRVARCVRDERTLVLAVLVGLVLRGYQLAGQIVADDEWHALYALTFRGYAYILSHFGGADYSIPLTVLYKTLAQTVGLTELGMRAPVLICGAAALVALPLLVRRYVGRPASDVFAWLLAIAPLHVYFSRYARPYSITMLLSVVAIIAFLEWASGGPRRWAWVYAAGAIMAPYFHLAVLPFVLSPLLFAVGERMVRRGRARGRSLGEVIRVGAAVAAGLTVLLIVPLIVNVQSLARKTGTTSIRRETLKGATQILVGTSSLWLVAAILVFAVVGWVWLARHQPRLALYVAFLAGCQVVVPVVTRPAAIEVSIVLARYSLPLLPLLLLLVAVGIGRLDAIVGRHLAVYRAGALAAVVIALLFAFGPLPEIYRYPNNWTNHALFQYEYDPAGRYNYASIVRPRRIPSFYRQLAAVPPGTHLIVEAPWYYPWHENPFPYYQAGHRQVMHVGLVASPDHGRPGEMRRSSGVRFRNAVHVGDAGELRRRKVRYVIFHRRPREEIAHGPEEVVDVGDWIARYQALYGAPVYEDPDIVAFDVAGSGGA